MEEPLVVGAVEVFVGLLVYVEIFRGDALFRYSDPLPFLILVFAGYPDVSVFCAFDTIDPLRNVKLSYHTPTKKPSRFPFPGGRAFPIVFYTIS